MSFMNPDQGAAEVLVLSALGAHEPRASWGLRPVLHFPLTSAFSLSGGHCSTGLSSLRALSNLPCAGFPSPRGDPPAITFDRDRDRVVPPARAAACACCAPRFWLAYSGPTGPLSSTGSCDCMSLELRVQHLRRKVRELRASL